MQKKTIMSWQNMLDHDHVVIDIVQNLKFVITITFKVSPQSFTPWFITCNE